MKPSIRLIFCVAALCALVATSCSKDDNSPTANDDETDWTGMTEKLSGMVELSAAQIYFEYNATANDAGIQVFLDGEDWKRLEILDPDGDQILNIRTGGGFKELGLTELRFEGAEPEGTEALDVFEPGEYEFKGATVDRERLVGSATLSHDLPGAPSVTPSNGESVSVGNTVISWNSVGGVASYQVIVESDANAFVLEISVPSSVTSLTIPSQFLVAGLEYKVEVLAIAPSGNRTITEGTFNAIP